MTRLDFLNGLDSQVTDNLTVEKVENKYHAQFPEVIQRLLSAASETIFFDDDYRLLSVDEIMDAEADLHVDFVNKKLLPLADCGENDFIVYQFDSESYARFNIVDECSFTQKKDFREVFLA